MTSFLTTASAESEQSVLRWSKRLHVQRYLRLALRISQMTPSELGWRLYTAADKRYRRGLPRSNRATRDSRQCARDFLNSIGSTPIPRIREHFDEHFFFGPSQRTAMVEQIHAIAHPSAQSTIALANSLTESGIDVLGHRITIAPGIVDWQADPRTRERHWSQEPLDEGSAISSARADVKFVWELNRHQFLPLLGRAYWLTGNNDYANLAINLVDDWIINNPSPRGVNWSSHLEVGMRAISWMWTLPYLLACPDLPVHSVKRWLGSFAEHYSHLSRNLSVYADPANHLIGELTALWMLCVCFPDLPDSSNQRKRSLKLLTREIERQNTADGVNREQASGYHRFVLDFCLQILILSKRVNGAAPEIIEERAESMLEFVAALAGEHGEAPMIGDSDDARGVPMSTSGGWDFRDLLSTGAVLFNRADWKALAGDLHESSLWLLGADSVDKYAALPESTSKIGSRVFSQGGYCFFKSTLQGATCELVFDAGPLGLWPNAAHGHADALSINIRLDGKFLLVDPGTGTYFDERELRDQFRTTSAHNTVSIDNLDQADTYDVFKWVNPMNVRLLGSFTNADFDYAAAKHDGYTRLRAPVTHYRSVLSIAAGEWLMVDHFEGTGDHVFTRHFHFPPGMMLETKHPHHTIALDPTTESGLCFSFPDAAASNRTISTLDENGLWSERYGKWRASPRLQLQNHGTPPTILITFVKAIVGQRETSFSRTFARCRVEPLAGGQAVLCRRSDPKALSTSEELFLVNPRELDLPISSNMRTNAKFSYSKRRANGTIARAFLEGTNCHLVNGDFRLTTDPGERYASYVD